MDLRSYLVPLLALSFLACAPPGPSDEAKTADTLSLSRETLETTDVIQAPALLESVTDLAADAMEGRGPGTVGDRLAREYLAERLADIGCRPAFPGESWEQPFRIVGITSHMPDRWSFTASTGETESFHFRDEYMAATGARQSRVVVEDAEVVFVGYGIQAPEEQWDDYKSTGFRNKILLMLNDDPDWDPALFAGERKLYYGRWTYKYESAARQGAAGAIIVHTTPSAGYPWQVVRTSWSGEQFRLDAKGEPPLKVQAWMTEEAAARLVRAGGQDMAELIARARAREFRPVELDLKTSLQFDVDLRETETANVAGILEGSDPELADEYVIYTAHHDHLGVGEPDGTGDRIYNGALDNGVAMAQVLAVAEAFAALPVPPRRSLMFLFPAAEEQGLLGSALFARSNVIHPGKMIANINLELGNVWGRTKDVVIFGMGKTTLEEIAEAAARRQDRTVAAERDVRAGWYYRSDQFSLARVGVPAIWFRSGTDFIGRDPEWGQERFASWIGQHYHQPTDEVAEDWNLEGLVEDARLAFWVGAAVADADPGREPRWYPGDEFEDERRASR